MRNTMLAILLLLAVGLAAAPVGLETARQAATAQLVRAGVTETELNLFTTIDSGNETLAYVFAGQEGGFAVVAADDALPPVVAYAAHGSFDCDDNPLVGLLAADLRIRRQAVENLPQSMLSRRAESWRDLLSGARPRFEQWPPIGATDTGGWVETRWRQSAPYNNFCPMDLASSTRAVAGCPAVAMAQILAYWETTNNTHFDDSDDYNHNYNQQNFIIDDDAATYDFPTFPELNCYLDAATANMRYQLPLTDEDKAALVFACGVAAHQVYAPGSSGTFGVDQALQAFQRFGFEDAALLTESDTDWEEQLAQNMKDARPAHLAMVNPEWTSGHNVVADGYNTDGYFHINFGWGGSHDGWYLLPDEFPYSLTVLEGVVVDIMPVNYAFASPDTLEFLDWDQLQQEITLYNVHDSTLTLETIQFDEMFGEAVWWFEPALDLPQTIPSGGSFSTTLCLGVPVRSSRDTLSTTLRFICDLTTADVTVRFNSELIQDVGDDAPALATALSASPNPFNPETTLRFSLAQPAHVTLDVFNLRGQRVATLADATLEAGEHAMVWRADGMASGVYFARLQAGDAARTSKLVLLK